MFDNHRYLTRGINELLQPSLVLFLWNLIDARRVSGDELDYLQIFDLVPEQDEMGKSIQVIKYSQEQPEYSAEFKIILADGIAISTKVFVIDDTTHSTMLLAEEY